MSMETEYCNKCGLLHDADDGDCLGCELQIKIKTLESKLSQSVAEKTKCANIAMALGIEYNEKVREITALKSKLSQSVEREKKLRECVEFYSDMENYTKLYDYKNLHYMTKIGINTGLGEDNGTLARQCLKQITEQKESDE